MIKASVVMPVYNEERYLAAAIDSILSQTFSDFTLIAIDDASSDNSLAILRSYRDKRIQIVENSWHHGVSYALNQGLARAEGEFVFRMDADDISMPQRFQRQADFMWEHPEVFACGTDIDLIDENGNIFAYRDTQKGDQRIKIALFLGETSLAHSSAVMRVAPLKAKRIRYAEEYPYAEDFELWCRCSDFAIYENLPGALLQYRHHNGSVSKVFKRQQRYSARQILTEHLNRLGLKASSEELQCHMQFALSLSDVDTLPEESRFLQWRNTLIEWNQRQELFDQVLFESELERRYQASLELWR